MKIEGLRYSESALRQMETGLFGWVSFVWAGIRMDGVAVRRTLDGQLTLSYPLRKDWQGRKHPTCRPVSDEVRFEIEEQVFTELGIWHLETTSRG